MQTVIVNSPASGNIALQSRVIFLVGALILFVVRFLKKIMVRKLRSRFDPVPQRVALVPQLAPIL
jgi:hypothetical protein